MGFHKKNIGLAALMLLVIVAVYFVGGWGLSPKNESEIFSDISRKIPSTAFLREVSKIPDLKASYLAIYIENPKIHSPLVGNFIYSSCPEETMGQSIEGTYHLILYRSGKIVNDVIIPSFSWDPNYSGTEQSLSYRNTKRNNQRFFFGSAPTSIDADTLEQTQLINFGDYTGEGKRHSFVLVGDQGGGCGHVMKLVAGYDSVEDEAVVYSVIDKMGEPYFWADNFTPNDRGVVDYGINCGDHGGGVQVRGLYQFDQIKRVYRLVSSESQACPN